MGHKGSPDTTVVARESDKFIRVVLPDGIGMVEIRTDYRDAEGRPRVRVDVASDTDKHGPDRRGRNWTIESGEPGVVFLAADRH